MPTRDFTHFVEPRFLEISRISSNRDFARFLAFRGILDFTGFHAIRGIADFTRFQAFR